MMSSAYKSLTKFQCFHEVGEKEEIYLSCNFVIFIFEDLPIQAYLEDLNIVKCICYNNELYSL